MKVNKVKHKSIWTEAEGDNIIIKIIDQRYLPFKFVIEDILTVKDLIIAIKDMHLRGAPLIGVAGAYGVYLSCKEAKEKYTGQFLEQKKYIQDICIRIKDTRPTAVNLMWAVDKVFDEIKDLNNIEDILNKSLELANKIAENDIVINKNIGLNGLEIIKNIYNKKLKTLSGEEKKSCVLNILTHCNAGWLATVDYGTAISPIFLANEMGIPVHIWVDETRPRNQGARLTAWELLNENIPHTVIADNTGGHLMQHEMVDMVIVGSDRTTVNGDVANKIGTYLKALAALDNNVPFYVALPTSTIDFSMTDGIKNIPIETRDPDEVKYIDGYDEQNDKIKNILLTNKNSKALNYGFDVTPARLITALITEKGVVEATYDEINKLK